MAEWSNAAVLKTVDLNGSGGSNPSLSAEKWLTDICKPLFLFNIPKSIPFFGLISTPHKKDRQPHGGQSVIKGLCYSDTELSSEPILWIASRIFRVVFSPGKATPLLY